MKTRLLSLPAALVMSSFLGVTVHAQTASQGAAPAYYIAEFEVADREAIRPYSERVASTFAPFGGRFVIRGGQAEALEGDPPMGRMVVIAFDTVEQARAWYHSPAYQELLPIRQRSGRSNTYIVQGLPN